MGDGRQPSRHCPPCNTSFNIFATINTNSLAWLLVYSINQHKYFEQVKLASKVIEHIFLETFQWIDSVKIWSLLTFTCYHSICINIFLLLLSDSLMCLIFLCFLNNSISFRLLEMYHLVMHLQQTYHQKSDINYQGKHFSIWS